MLVLIYKQSIEFISVLVGNGNRVFVYKYFFSIYKINRYYIIYK